MISRSHMRRIQILKEVKGPLLICSTCATEYRSELWDMCPVCGCVETTADIIEANSIQEKEHD